MLSVFTMDPNNTERRRIFVSASISVVIHIFLFFTATTSSPKPAIVVASLGPRAIHASLVFSATNTTSAPQPPTKPRVDKPAPSLNKKIIQQKKPDENRPMAEPLAPALETDTESLPLPTDADVDSSAEQSDTDTTTLIGGATTAGESADAIQTVALAKLTQLPRLRDTLITQYPEAMRQLGKEAVVNLELLIDENGQLRKIQVVKSAGPHFDQAAFDAITQARFYPAEIHGAAVAVYWILPVRFNLK